ncbi:MAG: cation transporter [Candidatus Limnocylindrales bacterium]
MDTLSGRPALLRRGLRLEYLTVGWNVLEGVIAIAAGLASGSVALIAFGIDSFVETISGAVLIWRLGSEARGGLDEEAVERVERRARLLVGVTFMLLAVYVAFESMRTLLTAEAPDASPIGIALTSVSIVVMLWLARAKLETGQALGSRALIADSRQTRACWYLSAVALAGLGLNALLGWWWADPVAALAIAVLLAREAREALSGEDDD